MGERHSFIEFYFGFGHIEFFRVASTTFMPYTGISVGDDLGIMGTSMKEPQSVRKRCALYEICIKGLRATCF
jgi:hypothetical protein